MPRKVRELIRDLLDAGFYEISGGGKGSHRKYTSHGIQERLLSVGEPVTT